jgi:PEP-CTERM motif
MKRIIGPLSLAAVVLAASPASNAQAFAIPEPGTLLLLGVAIVAVVIVWRKSSR